MLLNGSSSAFQQQKIVNKHKGKMSSSQEFLGGFEQLIFLQAELLQEHKQKMMMFFTLRYFYFLSVLLTFYFQ